MAQKSLTAEPSYVAKVAAALRIRYPDAQVDYEPILRGRYRFIVISKQFDDMGHPERQQDVWDLVEPIVSRSELLKIGMIITMTPYEASMSNGD